MAIQVVPHSAKFSDAVDAFNQRMRAGGSRWGFYTDPTPDWIPQEDGSTTWREYYLAIDDAAVVRGGYALKPQQWLVNGETEWVTDWQGPFTEAAIDPKYSPLMLKLFRIMLKEHPLLFSLGHGGTEEPIVDLLAKMGWSLHGVPFSFYVVNPYRFFRLNGYLRTSKLRKTLLDLLGYSGLGFVGVRLLHALIRLANRTKPSRSTFEIVSHFGSWADELWDSHKAEYRCLAVRDSKMMNALAPQSGWPGGTKIKIVKDGGAIGWAIVHAKSMLDDPRFGQLRVGLITDCFASTENTDDVITTAHDYLVSQDVDLIFANFSHPQWVQATRNQGYVVLEHRRVFAVSPAMQAKLDPYQDISQGLHLTNMDGHGPHGFQ